MKNSNTHDHLYFSSIQPIQLEKKTVRTREFVLK